MEMIDALHQVIQESIAASSPAGLAMGTVVNTSPLEIRVNTSMAPLRAPVLVLTAPVIEKKIPVLSHTHTAPGGETGTALDFVACVEHGKALPVENGYIILNRGLRTGDKVVLLKVQSGQRYLVLSRTFEVT